MTDQPFRLLETLRWTPGEAYVLLDAHLDRLAASARYFGWEGAPARWHTELDRLAAGLRGPSRVRLLVDRDGAPEAQAEPLAAAPGRPLRLGLAPGPVDTDSPWLYHKTTRREVYDRALAARPDCEEVLLWNARGEATEATRSNLVVELPEGRFTPPVSSGLLPGTLRAQLLARGEVRERVLRLEEVSGRRLFLVNSVRGWQEAALAEVRPSRGR